MNAWKLKGVILESDNIFSASKRKFPVKCPKDLFVHNRDSPGRGMQKEKALYSVKPKPSRALQPYVHYTALKPAFKTSEPENRSSNELVC